MVEEELAKAQARAKFMKMKTRLVKAEIKKPSAINDVHTNQGISTKKRIEDPRGLKILNGD